MSITADIIKLRFDVQPKYDQQQLNELKGDLKDTESALKKTHKEIEKNTDSYKRLTEELKNLKVNRDRLNAQKMRTVEEEKQLTRINLRIAECSQKIEENKNRGSELSRMYREQAVVVQNANKKLEDFFEQMDLGKMPLSDLISRQKDLNILVRNLKPDTDDFKKYTKALQETEVQIAKTKEEIYGTKEALDKSSNGFGNFMDKVNSIGFAITNALAIKDRIVAWADQYVQSFAKMDDAMTDVMKYTGQTKAEVEDMNEAFKQMTTRTAREELNALAGAAGRLGIQGKENIIGFVDAADKINVALGDDLGEGAIDQIGKLTMVFGEDKTKGLNGAMLATGSAINVLGANSSANTGFITEFTSSMAGMAVNAKISQTDIMGYASALSQAGIEGQTASGVFAQLITKMFTDPAKFAKAAKLDVKGFTDLLKTDANAAILQFLEGLKKNGGFDSLAPALKSLKMQGTQAVPVISSLINKMDELKKAQSDARKAYDEGTSIIEEFNNANSSAAAKLEMEQKALNDVATELGQKLMPIVEGGLATSKVILEVLSTVAGFVTRNISTISRLVIGIGAYTAAIQLATNATKIWNVVTKATPWGLVLAGLTAILVTYDKYKTRMAEANRLREELNKTESDAVTKYAEESREVKRLDAAMRDERVSLDERRKALNRLKEIIPGYNGMLDEEGRLTRDNKKAIDDYLVSLQKQIRLKAYQDKLQELYARQADQEEAQRTASDNYWSTRQTNTLQSGNSPTMSLMRWLGVGEEASLKRTLDEADKSLADTNNKISALENRIKDLGGSTVSSSESSLDKGSGEGLGSGSFNGSDSGGLSDKEISADRKKMKEEENLAKAHYDQELLRIKAFYGLRKNLGDEQKQAEFNAEKQYLEKMAKIRAEHQSTEAEKQEVYNKALDLTIKESNHNYEKLQRELNTKLQQEDYEFQQKQIEAAQRRFNNEYQSDEVYNQQLEQLEIEHQKRIIEIKKAGGQNASAEEKRLLDLQLQQRKKQQQQQQQDLATFQKGNNELLHQDMAGESMKEQLRLNQEAYDQQLISLEQFEQNKDMIVEEHAQKRQEIQQAAMDGVNNLMSSASQLFSAMQQRETSQVEAKYKKLIAAAKKNGKDTTKLEEQMEAEKAAIAKKYADRNFKIQVLQIIASTAAGIAKTIAELGMPWAIPFVAMAAAAGAMQLASAKAAADQAAGLYEGGYSDEYQEGYTAKGDPRKQAGVIPVHRNEFVANHKAVANPEVRPVLDVIDRHQKRGDISMLNSTRMLEEAYGRGRYRGGYSSEPEEKRPDGDSADNTRASNGEMLEILRRIEDNTADSLTVKELRDAIRRQERLEQNARR